MTGYTLKQKKIEKKEKEILRKICSNIKENLKEFSLNLKDSLKYIKYLVLPIISASLEDKSYNPFSEIIEKHISILLNAKMKSLGYKPIPLGYSSDLSFESSNFVINLDIKSANINNPADFKDEIALGFNQISYPGSLPLGIRGKTDYSSKGIPEIKTYPYLPVEYKIGKKKKINLTYGLLFIYPEYKKLVDKIRKEYLEIRGLLGNNLVSILRDIFTNDEQMREFLNYKPKKERFTREQIIVDNILRAYFIHSEKKIKFDKKEVSKLDKFSKSIDSMSKKLKSMEIKPVAIICISIPNGKLKPHYDEQVVSGKSFGKSIRYHYEEGVFKGLKGKNSRVIFLDYNKNYLSILKKHFREIRTYDLKEKLIK